MITGAEVMLLAKLGMATANAWTARTSKKKKKEEIRNELKKKLAAIRAKRTGAGSADPAV